MLSGLRNIFAPKPIVKAQYDNAKIPTRRKAGWDYTNASASGATSPYMPALKNRARAAVRNDPWAARAVDAMVSNLIGTGITPRPATKDEALRAKLIALWDEWAGECDSTGVLDIYGIQALVARAWYESGEVFIRLRPRYADDLEVPLQLQIIESDQVSYKNEVLENGHVIRSGIEYDAIGSRVAYWIHPNHPGDTLAQKQGDNNEPKRIPASEVLHVFKPLRPGQDRGVTLFAQVLAKLESLNKFDDAVLFRQELANLFVGFIRKPEFSDGDEDTDHIDPATGQPMKKPFIDDSELMLKPGATLELNAGEDMGFSTPPDAGSNYSDFTRQQIMSLAAGIGIPYELLSGDYSRVNDRTIRVALNDYRRKLESDQWNIIIAQFLKPLRKAWVDAAILNGHLTLDQRKAAIATHWTPHAHAYIHPVQDVQANISAVNAGFKSRAEVIRERGYDISEIDDERMADTHAPVQ